MHHGQALAILDKVFAIAERHGTTIPRNVAAERATLTRLASQVATLDVWAPASPPQRWPPSKPARTDPVTDVGVQQGVTRHELADLTRGIGQEMYQRAARLIDMAAGGGQRPR